MAIRSSFNGTNTFVQQPRARATGGGQAAARHLAQDAMARLMQCMGPERRGCARVEAIGRWLTSSPAHPAAQALQQAMAELAWLGGPRAALDGPALDVQLDHLVDALDREPALLMARCADVRALVCQCIESRLRIACREDCQTSQPYSQAWVMACSDLLLTPDGVFDDGVLPAIAQLLDQGGVAWLPPGCLEETRLRLRQLMDPDLKLGQQIDRLSCTHPLHPQLDRLRRLQFVGSDTPVRHQLASMVLCLHLTRPRQPADMGVCWLVAPKDLRHLSGPQHLLHSCSLWFEQGLLECPSALNEPARIVPTLYPAHAVQWAARAAPRHDEADSPVWARLLHALQCVQPPADGAYWRGVLTSVAQRLGRQKDPATVMQLLRGALIEHLNAAHGWALTESRLARPAERQSPGLREKAAALDEALQDCLGVLETHTLNLLSACWQLSTNRHVTQIKLQECWEEVQEVLLDDLDAMAGDLPDYLAQMASLFLSCADLRYERDTESGVVGFRLHLKLPGTSGRGTPVGNADQLLEWVERFSRELVKRFPGTGFAHHHAALMARIARARPGEIAHAFAKRGESLRYEEVPHGGIWFLLLGARLKVYWPEKAADALPVLNLPSPVKSDDFVQLRLSTSTLRWAVVTVVDAWIAPRHTLTGLVKMMRSVQLMAGPDLQFALKRLNGRLLMYVPEASDGSGAHLMTLRAHSSALQNLYMGTGPIDDAIDGLLVEPVRQALRQRLHRDEAATWLRTVLQSCVLKPNANLDAAVQMALARAMQRTPEGADDCSLQGLVDGLRLLLRKPDDSPFLTPGPWNNGLSMAVLNALPFEPPVVDYGDPNWEGHPLLLYCQDPILRGIAHFSASYKLTPSGERRLHFVSVQPSCLF